MTASIWNGPDLIGMIGKVSVGLICHVKSGMIKEKLLAKKLFKA